MADDMTDPTMDREMEWGESTRLDSVEASLRERERELEEAHRIARLGTWRWVRATDTVTWSEEVYRAFGLDPTTTAPGFDKIRERHPEASRARLDVAVQRAITTGEPYEFDIELTMPDGSRRWIIARGEAESFTTGEAAVLRGTIQDITERKLAEQRLARSEERYRALMSACSEIVWTMDTEGAAVDENAGWQAFTGQTFEELQGIGWAEAIHPEDRAVTIERWRASLSGGKLFLMRHRLRRHDGVYRTMDVRGVASRDESGKILEWVGMHTDVTEQIAAEAAVRESQSRFQRLYDSNLIGIGYPDGEGCISDGNDALLRIIGYSREDLQAGLVRWDRMTPPEYHELDLLHVVESNERGSCSPYRKEYIRKDGTRVPVMVGFARLGGGQAESIGFVLDLSEQKRAEDSAREREQRFSVLAESLPQLVWAASPDGDRIYTNQRYTAYTGLDTEQVLGAKWLELLHEDDVERTRELWQRAVDSGEPYLNEYRIRRHDGVYRSFLVRAVPVRNDAGEIERWLGSATDIHDQKLAEETQRRTEKLAAAGRLAASIAHEINNPLEAVTNVLYLALMDASLSAETHMYLTMAEQELARVAQVTTQTLRFHHQSVAANRVDLSGLMDSAVALYASRFEACGIALAREYTSGLTLFCRGDELRQVFSNLLSNAFDATRKGGRLVIRIRASGAWRGKGGAGLRVTIADSGDGIPAELRKKIFEPFVSTKDATGTGLGLWVSDGIVQKHKGRITLRSKTGVVNHGTVFSVFLPFDGIKAIDGTESA
jgi:PAS domain S-box-containing protein